MSRSLQRPGLAVCGLIASAVLITACEKTEAPQEVRLRPVKSFEVTESAGSRERTFSGVSRSSLETRLSFKVAGNIEKLNVAVGDTIEPGQVIAELDASIYELQTQQARADLARAQAEERNANANYQRVRGLYENNNASRNDLDTARAGAESARAQVRATRKALDLTKLSVNYTKLTATDRCSVASLSAEVGENVAAGSEIALMTCGDSIEVNVSVPENLIAAFSTGLAAQIRFDATSITTYQGTVTEVAVASIGGATFPVTIGIPDVHNELRSGLAAQVTFQFETGSAGLITVPPSAVNEDQEGRFVYLVTPSDAPGEALIKRQSVAVGELNAEGLELTEGVKPGDRVVTAGVSVIRDGMRVKAN